MSNLEYIKNKNNLIAIIIKRKFKKKGTHFLTENKLSLQLGYMQHPKNHQILPHYHLKQKRIVHNTNEILFIKSGKVRIDFFLKKKKFTYRTLEKGDFIAIVSGGHSFKMIKPTEMIEIKQGPYSSHKDKVVF